MTTMILNILLVFVQIFYMWLKRYFEASEQDRQEYKHAIEVWLEGGKNILRNMQDAFDQDAYLATIDSEKQLRFKIYRDCALNALKTGAGLYDLSMINLANFGNLVKQNYDTVLNIITLDNTIDYKANMIAKLLVDSHG